MHPYLDHVILELDNNAEARAVALGCKNHLCVGPQTSGKSAAIVDTLTETAKLNGRDVRLPLPQSSLVGRRHTRA